MATAIKTLVKNIRKKFNRRFQNVFFNIIPYAQATKEKTNNVVKLETSGGVEGHELIYSDENTKSQLTVDQPLTKNYKKEKKPKTGAYQKRYPTYKDKEESTRRW